MAYFGEAPETIRQKHIKAGLIYALWLFLSGENERLQQEIRKLRKYIGQLEDRQEREQCLGELEFLLGETQYNDVEAMAAYFKKSLQLLRQPVRFFSPQTIWGGGANSILFMFYRQAGTLQKTLDVFPQAMAYYYRLVQNHGAVLNMYWHRKRIFSAVIGKSVYFGNGSTECFTAQRTGQRRAVC